MNTNDLMADFMRFEKKDIIKQVPCPDGIDNCQTYHCEVVGQFYVNHGFRIDVSDWDPKGNIEQAMMCAASFCKANPDMWFQLGMSYCHRGEEMEYMASFHHHETLLLSTSDVSDSMAMCQTVIRAEQVK